MAVNLSKGQRVSLDKDLTMALVGLGWDTNKYDGGADFDLDASAFMLGADGRVRKDEDFIFYNNLESADGSVRHSGDNLTGEGEGDDEVLLIDFTKVPADVQKIAITVTISTLAMSCVRVLIGNVTRRMIIAVATAQMKAE